MSLPSLRRWLVPGATLSSLAVPLLVGSCPDYLPLPPGWRWVDELPSCDACEKCNDETPLDPVVNPRDELPQPVLGTPPDQREGPPEEGTGEASGEVPDGAGDEAGETDQAETETPPLPPSRPRIPDGVLQPRPDTLLRPGTQGPTHVPKGPYN